MKDTDSQTPPDTATTPSIAERFRGFLPVVVDVETAGFNAQTDALLEIACIPILMDEQGKLYQGKALGAHIEPFAGANLEASALKFTGINPNSPMRKAISEDEKTALRRIFKALKAIKKEHGCRQCILVGHNAHFDLGFLNAAIARTNSKNHSPFHAFSVLDTATLAALSFGHTVLARTCVMAGIEFNNDNAHSALYDTQKTAELFCKICNETPMLNKSAQTDDLSKNNED
ncbi:ribonuclease T [Moraxella caviae]|uniref:Ribonuclease T n=1 Tax=Moraxella caviae TaxID=34060 RepID=A0A1S9ZW12_9GAMM|nr:ribonuclease T [Moraxella caviae]OOR87712.1 ribonuclease T [Moraxella caviae]STZ10121.1 Ribonuclease T [Moraxella caviae]VEW11110.1 Ribonuclease T [Moraxella caviae]